MPALRPLGVVVTGGSGFIGSHFIGAVLRAVPQATVYNLDRVSPGGATYDKSSASRVSYVPIDLCHQKPLEAFFANHKVSHIIHFAAEPSVDRSMHSPVATMANNIMSTINVIECARHLWSAQQLQKVLYVSTDEVYGPSEPSEPKLETDNYLATSPYSASKAASEMLAQSYQKTYGLPVIITRCTNNYGPGQSTQALIPYLLDCLQKHKTMRLFEQKTASRDWLHVGDHVDALLKLLLSPGEGIYNIGAQNHISAFKVEKIVRRAFEELTGLDTAKSSPIEYIPSRAALDRSYSVNTRKLEQAIGWHPQRIFDREIKVMIKHYLASEARR